MPVRHRTLSAIAAIAVVLMATAWVVRWLNQPRMVFILSHARIPEHSEPIIVGTISPDGSMLAVSDFKHNRRVPTEVMVWDIDQPPSKRCVFEGPEMQCHALCFHPAGGLLAIGGEGGTVKIADVQEQAIVRTIEVDGSPPTPELGIDLRGVRAMKFSPDGAVVAIATKRREIEIWSTGDWQRLTILPRHSDEVNDVAFSADGARMLSVGGRWESIPDTDLMQRRPEVFEWNTTTWKKVREFEIPEATGFARRGVYLGDVVAAVGVHKSIPLINTSSGAVVETLDAHDNLILDLAFDGPGDLLISTSAEKTIVWDIGAYAQAASGEGARFIAYDPASKTFATTFAKDDNKIITLSKIFVKE